MTQTFDLSKMGLTPMSNLEMERANGGGIIQGLTSWFIQEVINNWDDIKAGFKEGYTAKI